ncbi:aspartate kinase [Flaviaesturariibacter aridisoli]|uniref:Aspartokinase n=1 Tax=Flaviaesturariibacter aridisoli TaxID=2545761 RepID=A0A4R4E140_9BACT|nr:aspartate kinase [Flaviaesturariibacter aridisoli]TCZ68271.1 aspartate kinase [Flaviaesturariibacter aridisoli]
MNVFKFGGASVSTPERVRNVGAILGRYPTDTLLVVISAMGKTTNALEKVTEAFFAGNKDEALQLFEGIKDEHRSMAIALGQEDTTYLNDFFTEVEWLLHDKPVRDYDYYYDQVVCVGELLSTAIVSRYLNDNGVGNQWLDVRDILRTDDNFRDAQIDWNYTGQKVQELVLPALQQNRIVLTQGFIGSTDGNESTTLGREGSDYTAAVFANLLGAEGQTIWKDVQGVMNADPKQYEHAQWIRELNYREVIEMAYYGAQVIHPKTIKPLQNKSIPLYVKSFIDPAGEGTIIHNSPIRELPPIIVYKRQQVLVELATKDFSFVGEGGTAEVYRIFEELKFRPNLTQNGAVSFLCVIDEHPEKVEALAHRAAQTFDVQLTRGLTLLTIRHYNDGLIGELCGDSSIILKQQTPETIQVLLSSSQAL